MVTYFGENGASANGRGVTYVLGDQIKHGTEGTVYSIEGNPGMVAKVYAQKRYDEVSDRRQGRPDGRAFMHAKLREMVRQGKSVNSQQWSSVHGHSFLAWPADTLVDANGRFCGYVMPRVKGKGNLYAAIDEGAHDGFFGPGNYTWRTAIKIAKQLAYVVGKLHDAGIVVGDFNPQNFLIDSNGFVSFCDTDSYTISPKYKTFVAFPGYVAPELQGKPWSMTRPDCQFTKESDVFSLSCLIFQLLTGKHPFNGIVMRSGMNSVSQSSEERNITNGDCPYVHHGIAVRQPDAPDVYGLLFPPELRDLCNRCFDYTVKDARNPKTISRRPTAADWYFALDALSETGYSGNRLTCCKSNAQHYYLPGAGISRSSRCPWCERDEHFASASAAFRSGADGGGIAPNTATSVISSPNMVSAKNAGGPVVQKPNANTQTTQGYGLTPNAAKFCKTALKWAACAAVVVTLIALVLNVWPIIPIALILACLRK
ncbi:MAG: hypothetical protein Q4A07_00505 [Coriobacteriales bacterium]|nr:hypothetical protein [Coriobacteriales bacterium]